MSTIKLTFFTIALILTSPPLIAQTGEPGGSKKFAEVWAYLMDGEEQYLSPFAPISDLGYFGAGISATGELVGAPRREKIGFFKGRTHLVVAEVTSYMATHFVMDPTLPLREPFIKSLVQAAQPFDGVQIDFEKVLLKDKELFYSFLRELRSRLPGKVFSLAVPALVSDSSGIWDYGLLNTLADKIVVMAYDEHWSGGTPGSIASLAWCEKVARYAKTRLSPERLIMGLPFYGRAWVDKSLARAYKHSSVTKIMGEEKVETIQREQDIPFFEYNSVVTVKVFFEDALSLLKRLSMYQGLGVSQVSFWRLGQEDVRVWDNLSLGL